MRSLLPSILFGLLAVAFANGVAGSCPPVRAPQWGSVRERVLKGGSLQTVYSCEPGRRLKGHKILTCNTDHWNHPIPSCMPLAEKSRRYDLYLGDEPPRNKPIHRKDGANKPRLQSRRAKKQPLARFNETFAASLDASCHGKQRAAAGKLAVRPAVVEHAKISKTARKNSMNPFNKYQMAVYECVEGYALKNPEHDRLFCREARWLGVLPECVKKDELPKENAAAAIERCESQRNVCEQVCLDGEDGIKCSCFDGYRLEGSNVCIDIDECSLNDGRGACERLCNNLPGSYECSCSDRRGYKLNQDNHTCEDENECADSNWGCSHVCVNTPGSAFCQCPRGYELTDDFKTCQDVNECIASELACKDKLEDCINTEGSYKRLRKLKEKTKLLADDDYDSEQEAEEGDYDEEGITESSSSSSSVEDACELGRKKDEGGVCVDINECEEDEGTSHGCDHRNASECLDLNECLYRNGGCNGDCINTPGSYYCVCADDDLVLAADARACISIKSKAASCRALEAAAFADVRCPGYPPAAVDYPAGAKCQIRCARGFRLHGSYVRSCQVGGRWDGRQTVCVPDYAYYPATEIIHTSAPASSSSSTAAPHTPYNMTTAPRAYIRCPSDQDVQLSSRRAIARVTIPQPNTNVDWYRNVEASPAWAKQLTADLPAGMTMITFTAWSPGSNHTAACRMHIQVRVDTESPRVLSCPRSFEVRLIPGERERQIFWQEPLFSDNVGIEHTYKSREPGQSLRPADHNVRYIASDGAGNRAECHFTVRVREAGEARGGSSATTADQQPPAPPQPQQSYQRMLIICPDRAPQEVSLSHRWRIPSGCYMRYTRLFSGAYSWLQRPATSHRYYQHQRRRNDDYHQSPSTRHEVQPAMRRAALTHTMRAYPAVDYDADQSRQQLQLQQPRDQVYYPVSAIHRLISYSRSRQPYANVQTRLLRARQYCCSR